MNKAMATMKLKLGKGSSFVKSRLQRYPQEDAVLWAADTDRWSACHNRAPGDLPAPAPHSGLHATQETKLKPLALWLLRGT